MNPEPPVSDDEIHDAPGSGDAPLRAIVLIVAVVAIACVALSTVISRAVQPPPPIIARPAVLDFGNVPQYGIVQAAVLIEQARNSGQQAKPNIAPGPAVAISTLSGIARRLVESRWIPQHHFLVDVDTSKTGPVESHITIAWEKEVFTLPVRYTVRADAEDHRRILIAQTPFNGKRLTGKDELDAWRALAISADFDVEYIDTIGDGGAVLGRKDLAPFDTILLATDAMELLDVPAIYEKLLNYSKDGGTLIIAANAQLGGSVDRANKLLVDAGLKVQYKQLPEAHIRVQRNKPAPTLDGVSTLHFIHPSPIQLKDPAIARIIVPVVGLPEHAYIATAQFGSGQITVLGESQWWRWLGAPGGHQSDNFQCMKNLLSLDTRIP